jgi:hypothetical protein
VFRTINKKYSFTQLLPLNQYSDTFSEVLSEGEDLTYSATGKYYYFEVAGSSVTATVENSTEEFEHTHDASSFTAYYGTFTASEEITITFESDYTFAVRNIGVFNTPVTAFAEFMEYSLPTGYLTGLKITNRGKELNKGVDYKINNDKLYLKYDIYGEITIEYSAYPTTINNDTLSSYEFEIDEIAQEAMCLLACSKLMIKADPSLFDTFYELYQSAMIRFPTVKHPTQRKLKMV